MALKVGAKPGGPYVIRLLFRLNPSNKRHPHYRPLQSKLMMTPAAVAMTETVVRQWKRLHFNDRSFHRRLYPVASLIPCQTSVPIGNRQMNVATYVVWIAYW